jgi:hypothetical protein
MTCRQKNRHCPFHACYHMSCLLDYPGCKGPSFSRTSEKPCAWKRTVVLKWDCGPSALRTLLVVRRVRTVGLAGIRMIAVPLCCGNCSCSLVFDRKAVSGSPFEQGPMAPKRQHVASSEKQKHRPLRTKKTQSETKGVKRLSEIYVAYMLHTGTF